MEAKVRGGGIVQKGARVRKMRMRGDGGQQ